MTEIMRLWLNLLTLKYKCNCIMYVTYNTSRLWYLEFNVTLCSGFSFKFIHIILNFLINISLKLFVIYYCTFWNHITSHQYLLKLFVYYYCKFSNHITYSYILYSICVCNTISLKLRCYWLYRFNTLVFRYVKSGLHCLQASIHWGKR